MKQIQHKIFDQIEDTFASAIRYYDGFVDGQKAQVKENFKLIEFDSIKNMCLKTKGDTEQLKYKNIKITKRNDNRWQARYRENGVYKYIYDKTQQGCYDKLKSVLKNVKKVETKNKTLFEWIDIWKKIYKFGKIKESTYYHIELNVKKHIDKSIGNMEMNKIKTMDIECLLNQIEGGRAKQSVYTILKDAFNKALKNKIIKDDIMLNIEKPKHKSKESKAFTREEQSKFLKFLTDSPLKDYFTVLLFQGMRRNELLALNTEDIDFDKKTINICKSINEKNVITSPKTDTSNRIMPLFNESAEILVKYKSKKGRIFNYGRNKVQNEFSKIVEKCNFDGFTIHSLRHTFITRWTEIGAPSKLIQKWVGHSDNKITEKVYTKINSDYENSLVAQKQEEFTKNFDTHFDTLFLSKNKKER